MNPSISSAGYVRGHRTMPTRTPALEAIDQIGRARHVFDALGSSRMNPRCTSACEKQWSGSRSTMRSSFLAKYDAADRTPFFEGYIPVATAAHTGSGCVG